MKPKIGVIYYIPIKSKKYLTWNDGFVAAINLIKEDFQVKWFNLDEPILINDINDCNLVLAKSNWNWHVDRFIQKNRKSISRPILLLLSGSIAPPSIKHILTYAHIFYETPWYSKFMTHKASSSLAFGTNTDVFHSKNHSADYDFISIGSLVFYKRHHYLLKKKGKRIIVGDCQTHDAKILMNILKKNEIGILDYQPPETLNDLINKSKVVYIPAELHGGGERALLEGMACKREIEFEKDNPKLASLFELPILDHHFYANQIRKGINENI